MVDVRQVDDQLIMNSQQYKIWKKHVPFLYQVQSTYQILTCTQTVEWIQDTTQRESTESHYCIIGTNSFGTNKLFLLRIDLPLDDQLVNNSQFKYETKVGEFGLKRVIVEKEIERYSQINKARKMPGGMLVAVKCGGNPHISLLNLESKSSFQEGGLILEGHTAEGMGLQWNPINHNIIVSGSSDRRICVWDINSNPTSQSSNIKPFADYTFHSMGVEDVSWNHFNPDIFASGSQDRLIAVWDLRQNKKKPQIQKSGHVSDVYSVKFSPHTQTLLISSGQDGQIALWDTRFFSKRLHTFTAHTDAVNCLKWSPNNSTQFASGSSDKSIIFWDLLYAGTDDEVQFIHGGHQSKVLDFDISKNWENLVVSSQEYNLMQVWKPNQQSFTRSNGEREGESIGQKIEFEEVEFEKREEEVEMQEEEQIKVEDIMEVEVEGEEQGEGEREGQVVMEQEQEQKQEQEQEVKSNQEIQQINMEIEEELPNEQE